jgi:AAA domain
VEGISFIIYGSPKVGKSFLGDTSPPPRLILDAEGGSRFTPSTKKTWDPAREKPPTHDGSWDTCLVPVHSYGAVRQAYDWLYSGQHPFNSVVIDSISETQQRCVDDIAGMNPMQVQDWGTLLRTVSALVRGYRDLITHPTRPLLTVVMIAMMDEQAFPKRPLMQGKMASFMPYYVDICGYLGNYRREDGTEFRRLMISPSPEFIAGERVGGRLGNWVDDPDIGEMLTKVTGWQQSSPAGTVAAVATTKVKG